MSMQQVDVSGMTFTEVTTKYGITDEQLKKSNPLRVSYIIEKQYDGSKFAEGTFLYIINSNTGGLDILDKTYYQSQFIGTRYHRIGKNLSASGCYFIIYRNGTVRESWVLPSYPNEFSDTNSATFNSTDILGRSVAYQTYNTSSRSVSFTLTLHEELVEGEYDYIHQLVAAIESANYPYYSDGVVEPPEIQFIIGKHFNIKGILTQCSANWRAPIIDGKLVNCELSLAITETNGPYSMNKIGEIGGFRG